MKNSRRKFIKTTAAATVGAMAFSAQSYARIMGANDRVNVGIVGYSDRFRGSLLPSFLHHNKELNFDIVALSDIWKIKREKGHAEIKEKVGHDIKACRNNDELYGMKDLDAVIVSTADFQHALHCAEGVRAGCDVNREKPLAETMEDARTALKVVRETKKIVQIGSQRRSGRNYHAANESIKPSKFGPITMVELTWNVNQTGRRRRVDLV